MKIIKHKISLILVLSTVCIFPALAKAEKDCNDIPIFKRHLELTACDLEKWIDSQLQDLTDVKIIWFRYKPIDNFLTSEYSIEGVLQFSANYEGEEIQLRCSTVHAWRTITNEHFNISAHYCSNRDFNIPKILTYTYHVSIIKDVSKWEDADETEPPTRGKINLQ